MVKILGFKHIVYKNVDRIELNELMIVRELLFSDSNRYICYFSIAYM